MFRMQKVLWLHSKKKLTTMSFLERCRRQTLFLKCCHFRQTKIRKWAGYSPLSRLVAVMQTSSKTRGREVWNAISLSLCRGGGVHPNWGRGGLVVSLARRVTSGDCQSMLARHTIR